MRVLLETRDIRKSYPVSGGFLSGPGGVVRAVDGVSLAVREGETLGLVGESGCGKSTLGRLILRLEPPSGGAILYEGDDILSFEGDALKQYRRRVQMIFQDPYSSLNPRMSAGAIIGEPLLIHGLASRGDDLKAQVGRLANVVGLTGEQMDRYPHEFSGGQRQRIGIARAIALKPKLIVADEPVSALDVSIQAQVLNLLRGLQQDFGLTYLFISHDLSVVHHVSDRIAVMYFGKIVELAGTEDLYDLPLHPYTKALLSAVPIPEPGRRGDRMILKGDIPNPLDPPKGCAFHPRCPERMAICDQEEPPLRTGAGGRSVACHLVEAF